MRQQLLDADAIGEGLIYHKAPLSQRKLVSKLAAAGFVLYPTSRAEASVAHVARAMLMGCIPCLLYTSPSPRDVEESRMPSSA